MKKSYMYKEILSLSFEYNKIYMAIGKNTNKKVLISRQKVFIPKESEYTNGRIIDTEGFRKNFLKELSKLKSKTKFVAVTLENSEILVKEIEIENTQDYDEIESLINFEMNKQLLIDVDDYIIKYKAIENKDFEDRIYTTYSVVAMPRVLAKELYYFLVDCKLKPITLETNSISLEGVLSKTAEAIGAKPKGDEISNRLLLSYDEHSVKIKIVRNCVVRLSRIIIYENFAQTIEMLKNCKEEKELAEVVESSDVIEKIFNDINMILRYHTSQSSENVITEAFLYGSLASESDTVEGIVSEKIGITSIKFDFVREIVDIDNEHLSFLYNIGVIINLE